nr:helix-turn-helix transcriptional regulator [uncultured Butyrivibrio sp.]
MGEYLPGNLQERLRELREANGFNSRNKLADEIGIDRTTYGRIENGSTKTISSDILIKLSKLYGVPTDYILGISDTPEDTRYDIKELGLSVEAAKNLYSKKVDPRVVNELLVNDRFAMAAKLMADFFSGAVTQMLTAHNALLNSSVDILNDLVVSGKIPNDKDVVETKKKLKAAKIPTSRFELDKIQMYLMKAVREIQGKVSKEIADNTKINDKLCYEIIDAVKKSASEIPNMKDLPMGEKEKIVKQAILDGINLDPNMSDKDDDEKKAAVDFLFDLYTKPWKKEN